MNDPLRDAPSAQFQEFLADLRQRSGLQSDQAERVARATLSTLGRSVSGGQARQLAEWLPPELQAELSESSGQAQPFDRATFLDSVGAQTPGVDGTLVENQVRATFNSIRAFATSEQLRDTVDQLPCALAELFS